MYWSVLGQGNNLIMQSPRWAQIRETLFARMHDHLTAHAGQGAQAGRGPAGDGALDGAPFFHHVDWTEARDAFAASLPAYREAWRPAVQSAMPVSGPAAVSFAFSAASAGHDAHGPGPSAETIFSTPSLFEDALRALGASTGSDSAPAAPALAAFETGAASDHQSVDLHALLLLGPGSDHPIALTTPNDFGN